MKKFLFAALMFVVGFAKLAQGADGTVTGTIRTPSSAVPIANGVLTFTLNQGGVVAGSATLAASSVVCGTTVDGSIVGLRNPSTAPSVSVNTASGSLAGGTYYVKVVIYNASGVTLASPVRAATLGSAGTITVTAPSAVTGATGYKVYIGTTQGSETLQGTVASFVSNYAQSVPLAAGAALPATNTTTCTMTFNDSIIPTSTKYRVNMTDANGGTIPGFPFFVYLQGTSVNVSNGWPTARDVETRYFTPIIASPSSNATQSVNSPLTLNGYAITAGSIVLPDNNSPPVCAPGTGYIFNENGNVTICGTTVNISPQSVDQVQYCASFPGATAGLKISAAIAALPSTGGTIECNGLQGSQTLGNDPFSGITKPVTISFSGVTLVESVSVTIPANVTIVLNQGAVISVSGGSTLTINGGIIADLSPHFSGAGAVAISGSRTPEIYPEWFGAVRNGSTDDSASINRAIAAMTGGGVLRFSAGTYYMTDTALVSVSGFEVRGSGERTTLFKFVPTSAKSAWKFMLGSAATINDLVFRDCGFISTDSTYSKVAIDVVDGAEVTIERVTIGSLAARWTDSGTKTSVGIQVAGRQNVIVSNNHVYADKPIRLKVSPNTDVVELDASTFVKNTLVAYDATTNPNITIDDGVALTNVAFRDNNCVLGSSCIYWVAPSNTIDSWSVIINNNRWEQTTVGAGGYGFDLEPTGHQAFGLDLSDNYLPGNSSSIKIRNFKSGVIKNNRTDNTGEVLNLDNTSFLAVEDNFFNINAGATLSLGSFVPTRWCGNDRTGAGYVQPHCSFGVKPTVAGIPASTLLIPNSQVLSGMNAAGTAEVLAIGVTSTDKVIIAPGGTTEIQIGRSTIALGGGAAATLGTIGATGPATAGQTGWLQFYSAAGDVIWVPYWR